MHDRRKSTVFAASAFPTRMVFPNTNGSIGRYAAANSGKAFAHEGLGVLAGLSAAWLRTTQVSVQEVLVYE